MTLFGASTGLMKRLHGNAAVLDAHAYMERAIAALEEMLQRTGSIAIMNALAFSRSRRQAPIWGAFSVRSSSFRLLASMGFQWLDRDQTQDRVHSHNYLGSCLEPSCGLINPVKWADALRRVALDSGVRLYEATRVTEVRREGGRYRVKTEGGSVVAERIVYAANGYTDLLPGLDRTDACIRLHCRDREAFR